MVKTFSTDTNSRLAVQVNIVKRLFICFLIGCLGLLLPETARAIFPQTQSDLRAVEDRLSFEFSAEKGRELKPVLVATPQAHWQESKADFAPAMMAVLARVFSSTGDLIPCAECLQSRVFVSRDNRMVLQNGELSLTDLARLREKPGFAQAKSVFISRETPAGIEIRLISINDGRILYAGLIDAMKSLDAAEPPLRLARELDRRERGEALTYFHFDLGLYPQGLLQATWLEQWGSRNQHLSGFAVSVFNPIGAVGGAYRYMLPSMRRVTVGATVYYGLSGIFESGSTATDLGENLVAVASLNLSLSGAYGLFFSVNSKGVISAGVSLQNPVFLPFLF